mmetsp:Transcript_23222/g.45283  ORF Transcript_23222/g.45283 Transcript_23222/m.45283 type:complete len:226 (+) Transcript_23222:1186-1863(+)
MDLVSSKSSWISTTPVTSPDETLAGYPNGYWSNIENTTFSVDPRLELVMERDSDRSLRSPVLASSLSTVCTSMLSRSTSPPLVFSRNCLSRWSELRSRVMVPTKRSLNRKSSWTSMVMCEDRGSSLNTTKASFGKEESVTLMFGTFLLLPLASTVRKILLRLLRPLRLLSRNLAILPNVSLRLPVTDFCGSVRVTKSLYVSRDACVMALVRRVLTSTFTTSIHVL